MIKQLIFGIAALLLMSNTKAQFLPMIKTDRWWSSLEVHCNPTGSSFSSNYYKFQGDTILNGLTYSCYYYSSNSEMQDWELYGFFREDTLTGQCWYRTLFPEIEGLVYDFGLSLGEKAYVENNNFLGVPFELYVVEVDSIMLDNQFRKRIVLMDSVSWQTETWVEGIGSLWGFHNAGIAHQSGACGGELLLCFNQSGQVIYHDPAYNECFFEYTSLNEPNKLANLHVYPNPATEILHIETDGTSGNELKIYNSQGKCVHQGTYSEIPIQIPIGALPVGLYHGRLTTSLTSLGFSFLKK